jgi:hypothetical protein
MTLKFEPRSNGSLKAEAVLTDDGVCLTLGGTADSRETDFLDGVLTDLHDEALRLKASTVDVDFRQLEFMNSTAFKSFLTWITELLGTEERFQYQVRFQSSGHYPWQRRSLEALRCFAVNLISIDA